MKMLIFLLTQYYRSGLRGSHRASQLINKIYPLNDVDVPTAYGLVNTDLTVSSGQAIAGFRDTPNGKIIAKHAHGICYDIGAHWGIYSVLMAQKCQVFSFEPNPAIFSHLQKTAVGRTITPFNVALSDRNGTADFYIPDEPSMASLVNWLDDDYMSGITQYAGTVHKSECQVRTLDAFVAEHKLPLPNFIKLDVEGAEISIFRGGCQTLEAARPTIFFEVSSHVWEKFGTTHQEGFDFLKSLGYRLFKDQEQLHHLDYEWIDVLAVPDNSVIA